MKISNDVIGYKPMTWHVAECLNQWHYCMLHVYARARACVCVCVCVCMCVYLSVGFWFVLLALLSILQ
jgi:hypothetical protein